MLVTLRMMMLVVVVVRDPRSCVHPEEREEEEVTAKLLGLVDLDSCCCRSSREFIFVYINVCFQAEL